MEIQRVVVKNFKKVSDVDVLLDDITFLVGGNNSGKSSILQAIHMAASCAQIATELQQRVIAESSLRYCPTGDFVQLGNSGPYENPTGGSRGIIEFYGKTGEDVDASYKVEIYKARNFHNVGVDRSGVYPGFGSFICDPKNLFSVYVPGLAGIPHHEEMQNYASVFRKAAGGEANLVFRNIVRLIHEKGHLEELEDMLFNIIGACKFVVNFDQERDLYVDVKISLREPHNRESYVPIDLSGTGILQVTQILAYVILFRPRLLLLDEPDSHLHPSRQALLSYAFSLIVGRFKCKIVISTHSRHLISSAPAGTKLTWIKEGRVEAQDDNGLAAMLMDIGALDQIDKTGADILICTEDKGKGQIEKSITHLGLNEKIKVISYNGVTNAASAAVIQAISQLFLKKPLLVVHRDRDFLTPEEILRWSREFTNRGMRVFCPILPDVESYFVNNEHVAEVYGIAADEAYSFVEEQRTKISKSMRSKFKDKRREAISRFWRDGGAPATSDLWPDEEVVNEHRTLGKELLKRLNEEMPQKFGRRQNLLGKQSQKLSDEILEFLTPFEKEIA